MDYQIFQAMPDIAFAKMMLDGPVGMMLSLP